MGTLHIPVLESGNAVWDKAFELACGDFSGNIIPYCAGLLKEKVPVICAGEQYRTPWTRDAAFNTWYAGAILAPETAKNTLLSVLTEQNHKIMIDEDSGQYWDMVIWAWGAWNYYLATMDRDFLQIALPAIENTLENCIRNERDPADGLFRGGACFQDGISGYPDQFISDKNESGILCCLKDSPRHEWLAKQGHGLPCKALSSNCLYLLAGQCTAEMRKILNLPENKELTLFTEKLLCSIRKRFWNGEKGRFRYLIDVFDPKDRQEGLGIAFAVLAGVADPEMLRRQMSNLFLTPHGLPCVWPEYERYSVMRKALIRGESFDYYARHSGSVWPQVNAAFVSALSDSGYRKEALREMDLLANKAFRDGMFFELYHPETGLPDGGLQEWGTEGIIHWKSCRRQTWAATGYIHMVLKTLFGMKFTPDGITVQPLLPDGCGCMRIRDLHLQSGNFEITVRRTKDNEKSSELPFRLKSGRNEVVVK